MLAQLSSIAQMSQRRVRSTLHQALNYRRDHPEDLLNKVPSTRELQQFERTAVQEIGPKLSSLKLDLASTQLATAWNKAAAEKLAHFLMAERPTDYPRCVQPRVLEAFMIRIKTLRRYFRQASQPQTETMQADLRLAQDEKAAETRSHNASILPSFAIPSDTLAVTPFQEKNSRALRKTRRIYG